MPQEKLNAKITVVGGPFAQDIDPVLRLVPTGNGLLAAEITNEMRKHFNRVDVVGNFLEGDKRSFSELQKIMDELETNVLIFLPHLPNILLETSLDKIRLEKGEKGILNFTAAPKIVAGIKEKHPEVLLVPFKLADRNTSEVEIVKWMLEIHSALACYSILGNHNKYFIIDALGNQVAVARKDLPQMLALTIINFTQAIRRRSVRVGEEVPEALYVKEMVDFSKKMQPAFAQLKAGNVMVDRWPGNFSFRCTHSFLSSRVKNGFIITKRNVAKTGLTKDDFVFVDMELKNDTLQFQGKADAKPSIDTPVHRMIYRELPWVNVIVHGHLHVEDERCVYDKNLSRWPCGAENEGIDIVKVAPKESRLLWIANVDGHGFVALIGDENPKEALGVLSRLKFKAY